jgi:NAD(P)-dependent dehydrogenase (short-subunit alcohol dehydrogenase family)
MELSGRRVVVVGSGGALGSGLVDAFTRAGASVLGLNRIVRQAPGEGVELRAVDVSADAELGQVFDSEPPPWAVVNTVGGFAPRRPVSELDPVELDGQLRLNLVTAALITKHALRRLTETGEGRLVHTASRVAVEPTGAGFPYSVSKLGVVHLVRMAAAEVRGSRITVNCVMPSIIDTPANRAALPHADHSSWPTVAEVAAAFVFLASPAAHLISGAAIPVYGRA